MDTSILGMAPSHNAGTAASHAALHDFLARCVPGDGLIDVAAWEAAGAPHLGHKGADFLRPPEARRIRRMDLAERRRQGAWIFASSPGNVASIEGTHAAVEALHAWGEIDLLDPAERLDWAEVFRAWQDPRTGCFSGPYVRPPEHPTWADPTCTHPWLHMQDHLVACLVPTLLLLGGRPRTPLSEGTLSGRFLDADLLRRYLNDRDWSGYRSDGDHRRHSPWWLGNEFWYPGVILWAIAVTEAGTPAASRAEDLLHHVWFAWHDRHLNAFGFWDGRHDGPARERWWGRLADDPAGLSWPTMRDDWHWIADQIMGGAHQLWLYEALDHTIPDHLRQRQTDVLLGLQHGVDHRFGLEGPDTPASNSNDCTDVDCLTLLANNFHRQDHRRAEIQAACERAVGSILRDRRDDELLFRAQPDRAWTHHATSYECYSPADQANVHQQAFSLWAVRAGLSVLDHADDPLVADFLAYPFRNPDTHWLHVPARAAVAVR